MIDLHFWPTPNGKKVTILLEECALPYRIVPCNIQQGDQFKAEFLAMNPNHRMPVMVDHDPPGGGDPITVFESGAIMMYLAEKAGRFWPQDLRGKYEVTQWVIWQMANQEPKLGECGHFRRLGDNRGDQSYAVTRFTDETNRLYGVLNNRLYRSRYVAGDEYTIADMIESIQSAGITGKTHSESARVRYATHDRNHKALAEYAKNLTPSKPRATFVLKGFVSGAVRDDHISSIADGLPGRRYKLLLNSSNSSRCDVAHA